MMAIPMEFAGSIVVVSHVTHIIRNKPITFAAFEQQREVLMLGVVCVLIGSSTWLTVVMKLDFSVSMR